MHFLEWKYMNFDFRFPRSLFPMVQLTIFHHCFRYASLSLNELKLTVVCMLFTYVISVNKINLVIYFSNFSLISQETNVKWKAFIGTENVKLIYWLAMVRPKWGKFQSFSGYFVASQGISSVLWPVWMHIFHDLVKYICTRSTYPHLIIIRQTIFFKTWFVFIFCIMFGTRCRQFSWCWKRSLVLTFLESLTTISLNAANYRKNYNIRLTFVGNKIAVFDFNSSPIVNTMKNSCGLWDLKIS